MRFVCLSKVNNRPLCQSLDRCALNAPDCSFPDLIAMTLLDMNSLLICLKDNVDDLLMFVFLTSCYEALDYEIRVMSTLWNMLGFVCNSFGLIFVRINHFLNPDVKYSLHTTLVQSRTVGRKIQLSWHLCSFLCKVWVGVWSLGAVTSLPHVKGIVLERSETLFLGHFKS